MGTSWHILCGNSCQLVPSSDNCLVGYELTSLVANCGTSWHHLWYELTSIRGTSWHGYELTWVRVDMGTSWPVFCYSITPQLIKSPQNPCWTTVVALAHNCSNRSVAGGRCFPTPTATGPFITGYCLQETLVQCWLTAGPEPQAPAQLSASVATILLWLPAGHAPELCWSLSMARCPPLY